MKQCPPATASAPPKALEHHIDYSDSQLPVSDNLTHKDDFPPERYFEGNTQGHLC